MAVLDSPLIADVLEEYGRVTRSELAGYIPWGEPRHQLYDLVRDYPARGGRMMRPSLCLATTSALGGEPFYALKTAVAIELMHNSFLVHDDIEDESDERRGLPTLHESYGLPLALNAGDALGLLSMRPLVDNAGVLGPFASRLILDDAIRMALETVEGQAIELGWRRDNQLRLTEDDYLAMVLKKTCWYSTIFPMRAGAIVAGRSAIPGDGFVRFGFFLGAAFQIQDDLLNISGDPERYGKELDGDLREGKRTLILIRFLQTCDASERGHLATFLSLPRGERDEADVRWLHDRLYESGCIEYARGVTHALAGAAQHEFALAFEGVPDSRDRRFLEALPRWVIERT